MFCYCFPLSLFFPSEHPTDSSTHAHSLLIHAQIIHVNIIVLSLDTKSSLPKAKIAIILPASAFDLQPSPVLYAHVETCPAWREGNPLHMLWKHSTSWIPGVISTACAECFLVSLEQRCCTVQMSVLHWPSYKKGEGRGQTDQKTKQWPD